MPPPIPKTDATIATPAPAMGTAHPGTPAAPIESESLGPGDLIDNKYEVVRVLGRGGMGLVLEATHLQLREPVALKFMNAAMVANPEAAARFTREARAAARLKGEHICRVLDMGETPAGDRYIVIEYLEGLDLSQALRQRGPLPYAEAVDYIMQACEAMAEAHAAGIVHRDLKPANLFLTTGPDGAPSIKVLDFGISKLMDPDISAVVTTTRSLMGSPLYMAPEQLVSARDVDPRTDIWSLATVLYRLVSGQTPFYGDSLPEVVAQVLHTDPPPLSSLVPGVPPELDAALERALAKSPQDRYPSVAAFAGDLAAVLPGSSHRAVRSAAVLMRPRRPTTASGTGPPPIAGEPSSLSLSIHTLAEIPADSSFEVDLELEAEPEIKIIKPPGRPLRWALPLAAVAAVAVALYLSRDRSTGEAAPPVETSTSTAAEPAPEPAPAVAPLTADAAPAVENEEPEPDKTARPKRAKRPRRARRAKNVVERTDERPSADDAKSSGDLIEPGAVTKKPKKPKKPKQKKPELIGPELLD